MPDREESIWQRITGSFDFMKDSLRVVRERRLEVSVPREKLIEVMTYLKNETGFDSLCTITGLDSGENFELIYHLASGGIVLNLKAFAPKSDPVFDTVTGIYEGATMYELEVHNLLGITLRGIPEGIKYPLPDDWPDGEYPLRKDWNKEPPVTPQEGG